MPGASSPTPRPFPPVPPLVRRAQPTHRPEPAGKHRGRGPGPAEYRRSASRMTQVQAITMKNAGRPRFDRRVVRGCDRVPGVIITERKGDTEGTISRTVRILRSEFEFLYLLSPLPLWLWRSFLTGEHYFFACCLRYAAFPRAPNLLGNRTSPLSLYSRTYVPL